MILENPAVRKAVLPVTVEQYHDLTNAGIIPAQTELIQGAIVKRMGKSPLHTRIVEFLVELLREGLGQEFFVRQEQPITLSDSEPEPDVAVIRGVRSEFYHHHPSAAEWIIEVAVSTEELDQQKTAIYAAAGVREYWIVLPQRREIHVYRQPIGEEYRTRAVETGPLSAEGFPEIQVDLSAIWT